jgi:hypothetical protein
VGLQRLDEQPVVHGQLVGGAKAVPDTLRQ